MNKYVALLSLAVLSAPAFSQSNDIEIDEFCMPVKQETHKADDFKKLYPYKPLSKKIIDCRLNRLSENKPYISDIREMTARGLMKANTKTQPWGGSFWPLNQGLIANTYQDKNYSLHHGGLNPREVLSWKHNYSQFLKRREKVLSKPYELNEADLATLAPSEKYDLLLGDMSFDLTNRLWDFTKKWGDNKRFAYLSGINIPAGYSLPKPSTSIKTWEGICHGWAVASGHADRPERTVWVTLPNNKRMPFYPNDMKALVSLMWANSTVQDSVISEGLRCNEKNPEKDEHGRYIDTEVDPGDKSLLPRCADVHPGIYHVGIVNILGVEGRSFVVDKASTMTVSNQPVSGYEYTYFNPMTGVDGSLESSAVSVAKYEKDPYKEARNVLTRYIVGVDMTLKYVDWEDPKMRETNFPANDKISDITFNYDLELDENYKIVGGQWRVKKDGSRRIFQNKTGQPDFFWIIPRDHKKYFQPKVGLPEWNFAQSSIPPKEFGPVAKEGHSFIYHETKQFGWDSKCQVVPNKENKNAPVRQVSCEFKVPRPQPLINVVDKLVEESRL